MLELRKIVKDYYIGDQKTEALRGVSLTFRKSEFVSILGPSGCGKTTLLNIVGGLDIYTSGDLVINGKSTKDFKDGDWDTYRNHSIGFVFQSYNLIPHQTVLSNVELALTLSGVSKAERRRRAKEALEMVGLGDQLNKRPNQMSGGQMQRVAIARALVNDPEIILADEPTGALDSVTSVQIMEILKKVSEKRLVIMVTHNPELAETYSTRIVKLRDGEIISDSAPYKPEAVKKEETAEAPVKTAKKKAKKEKRPSMSFLTALSLSFNNLMTKRSRTLLTSFAGSIGIIGIALILAVSQGTTAYIDAVQESTLSSYPMTLESTTVDMSVLMQTFMNIGGEADHEKDAVYKDPVIGELVNALSEIEASQNDLGSFKKYLENELKKEDSELKNAISGIQYSYTLTPIIYTKNQDGKIIKSDTGELMMEMIGDFMMQVGTNGSASNEEDTSTSSSMSSAMMNSMMGTSLWQELLPGLENGDPVNDLIEEQYDLIYGSWPNSKNEIILVVNENNELDDLTLYALGLLSEAEIDAIIDAAANGKTLPDDSKKWSYEDICNMTFKAILPYDCYTAANDSGTLFVDMSEDEKWLEFLYEDALELNVVGIVRPNADADTTMLTGAIGYTHFLTEHIIEEAKNSPVVQAQLANPTIDVLTSLPFKSSSEALTDAEKETAFRDYINTLSTKQKAEIFFSIQCLNAEQQKLDAQVDAYLATMQDKDALVMQISTAMAEQLGVSPDIISERLSELEISDLHELLRPSIEEQVKMGIAAEVELALSQYGEDQRAAMLDAELPSYTTELCALYYDEITVFSDSTYENNLVTIGYVELDSPFSINIYASSFENKDIILDAISKYNDSVDDAQKISYTDYLGIMMSSITTIINAITYVLIAFVAISLIVSSIMIGVITLISVQERTKEIGILRAIGASKKNVSSMFNAETMIVGFSSGLLGILVTYLLCIPINIILNALTGISNLKAILPWEAAVILVVISVLLTLFSGIIPSRSAAKKDPVVALRTE